MPDNIPMHIVLAKIINLPSQVYNGLQFILVLQGEVSVTINTKKHRLTANQFIVINTHDIYSLKENGTNIVLMLKLPFEYLRKECPEILQYQYDCYSENPSKEQHKFHEIRKTLINMMLTESSQERGYHLKNKASLFQLLNFLLTNFQAKILPEEIITKTKKGDRISSILNYIDENYKQPITLSGLAEKKSISVYYLSRYFKQEMGINFIDYLNIKRLKSSLLDLMHTDDSILTIALQNGFANSGAFITRFKNKYKETPSRFRHKYQEKNDSNIQIQADYESIPIDEIGGIPELVDYIRLYEYNEINNVDPSTKTVIPLDNNTPTTLTVFEKIINIVKCADILKAETQKQLILTQKKMTFQYALFQGVFGDGIFKSSESSLYYGYEYSQVFSFLQKINLTPFIQLNISNINIAETDSAQASSILATFLSTMEKYFSKSHIEHWKFEITTTKTISDKDSLQYYIDLYKIIKQFSPKISIGFSIMHYSHNTNAVNIARYRLMTAIKQKCPPDFITFKADPNKVVNHFSSIDTDYYPDLQEYYLSLAKQLQQILIDCEVPTLPLYMTEWNTLAGKEYIEFVSFCRSALVVDAMLSLSNHIKGLSFWLNDYNNATIESKTSIYSLGLFHYHNVRCTTFFLLDAYSRLGEKILFQNNYMIVTQNHCDEIIIMMWNPCFFDTIYALDEDFTQGQRKDLTIDLQGISDGLYNIKTFEFKLKFTFAINNQQTLHHGLDTYQGIDHDIVDYIQHVVTPDFSNYEKYIQKNYIIKSQLEHNAVILYILKKTS